MDNLQTYRNRRSFTESGESPGAASKSDTDFLFVVQKHAARRLHYDFRLELNGVLKSWAVPKGPSINPSEKRLAVHVEDHPVDYGEFEGVIPEGNYGAGTVIVWDNGIWEPIGDPEKGYEKGHLKFFLHGHKLQGEWVLARMGGKSGETADNWLLMKVSDDSASEDGEVLIRDNPESVLSARTLEEVTDGIPPRNSPEIYKDSISSTGLKKFRQRLKCSGARQKVLPAFVPPALPALFNSPPVGKNWLHEIKYDGYRIMISKDGDDVKLLTRNGKNWSSRFPALRSEISRMAVESLYIDGEMTVLKEDGSTSFKALQDIFQSPHTTFGLTYFAFDLLYAEGYDLRTLGLEERKHLLQIMLELKSWATDIRFSRHIKGEGADFFEEICKINLEGVISKKADSHYRSGRSDIWIKSKNKQRQEFVIGGFTLLKGETRKIGALLLGIFEEDQFKYAGKVGTGFSDSSRKELFSLLTAEERDSQPFVAHPRIKNARWVAPGHIVEVSFQEWTGEGLLRHPVFHCIREDKNVEQIKRDMPLTPAPASNIEIIEPERITLTSADRILYPEDGITKGEIAHYYSSIGEYLLPYARRRPLALVRCPDGYKSECFFQKHVTASVSRYLRSCKPDNSKQQYIIIDSVEDLQGLAQLGVLEIHCWNSVVDSIEYPDQFVLDLDPDPSVSKEEVIEAAFLIKDGLEHLGLKSFPRLTGGKGIHVVVPIVPERDRDTVKKFTKAFAGIIVRSDPARFTVNSSKKKRKGKIYIDYLRNGEGATAITNYSPRAREGAPVAAPVKWAELKRTMIKGGYTVKSILKRLSRLKSDPWEGYFDLTQKLSDQILFDVGIE